MRAGLPSHCSCVRFFVILWTVALQAPLSMGFSRQEYWSGLSFPSPGDLPDSGIEPRSPALQADTLASELPGKMQTRWERRLDLPPTGRDCLSSLSRTECWGSERLSLGLLWSRCAGTGVGSKWGQGIVHHPSPPLFQKQAGPLKAKLLGSSSLWGCTAILGLF